MTQYDVYLEVDDSGRCMAHVLDLPGCNVTAASREAALSAVPETIGDYDAGLRRHGEDGIDSPELITLNVVATSSGIGPFIPGDQAALFEPDRRSVSREEMERYLQLAAYNRADLLDLARSLSKPVRKWRADGDSMSINRILRHIGNAEQWYVSRLVEPETLPPEWADDADMPLFKFLKMARETAVARLRQLTDEELVAVFHPTHHTGHPEEAWTARKALRRLLEHEREHTGHIRQILTTWRLHLLARLAAERAGLLWQLRGLDEETLCTTPVFDEWTAKDLLVHVADWDAFNANRMSLVADGRLHDIQSRGGQAELDAYNDELYARRQDTPLEQALETFLNERARFLAALDRVPNEELHGKIQLPQGGRARPRQWAGWRYRHDARHAKDLKKWRKKLPPDAARRIGPRFLLRAMLNATRKEFLTLVDLVPPAERDSRSLCGVWTLKDLVGHLTDWELVGVDGLRQLVAGNTPEFAGQITDFDAWNNAKAAARREQPWEQVWNDFQTTRHTLLDLLSQLSDDDLARTFVAPWGPETSAYYWTLVWSGHEREHAIDVRHA